MIAMIIIIIKYHYCFCLFKVLSIATILLILLADMEIRMVIVDIFSQTVTRIIVIINLFMTIFISSLLIYGAWKVINSHRKNKCDFLENKHLMLVFCQAQIEEAKIVTFPIFFLNSDKNSNVK